MHLDLSPYKKVASLTETICLRGRVTRVVGLVLEGDGPALPVGGLCQIKTAESEEPVEAEVVGFRDGKTLLMPLGSFRGISPGSEIVASAPQAMAPVGEGLLGRVLNGLGEPLDGKPCWQGSERRPLYRPPLNPMERGLIRQPLDVGIRAINGLVTLGKGQRAAIMAGSGVGKSVLLGMMARCTAADVSVIGLIGERGREVQEFIVNDLGQEGLQRSVVVVATSDQPPLVRIRGGYLATTIAEYFREQGKDVLLMMDSLTRFAMACREVGIAAGEPPAQKAYTPTTFAQLARIVERAGKVKNGGSITGLYTVLVEGDDMSEPIADAVRSVVDGHVVLSRELAQRNHYPAIDVLASISRLMPMVTEEQHQEGAGRFRQTLALYRKVEDLLNIGAYVKGNNSETDQAINMIDSLNNYLRQDVDEKVSLEESVRSLQALFR
ncbi:MAG: FliI/YscN family ATPase [Deltaproteobacteria bacterium]|nr:FliI/YscN family ATPase [Deltaproteobacteria bacterium]MBW2069731.1 FliI/YscN family ATPase [Deltaproteobacteria bacterium]